MPLSYAASLASSFMLSIFAFDTTPVAVTVGPTCPARGTRLLRTSQVLPSFPVSRNSCALSPFDRQPVTSLTSLFDFASAEVLKATKIRHNRILFIFVFIFPPYYH